jgi:hypothetical protein
MHSILPPVTCHAMTHLARMAARTALPCAACTRTPSSLPSHTASVQYSIVSGRRPFLMSGAGPVDVLAPLPTMHRRLGLPSGIPDSCSCGCLELFCADCTSCESGVVGVTGLFTYYTSDIGDTLVCRITGRVCGCVMCAALP